MPKPTFKDPHIILDGFASLRRHHQAKKTIREKQLREIPVKNGARLLDIGTGPGLYLEYWLQLTEKPGASFDLIDHSAQAVNLCKEVAEAAGQASRVHCIQADLFELKNTTKPPYDVIFIGNTLEYIPDPVRYLRETVLPLLAPSGILALRDLDCAIMNCSGVDPALCAKIVQSRIKGCQKISLDPSTYQNPFLGRDMRAVSAASGLIERKFIPYYCEFRGPLDDAAKSYLSHLHTTWYVEDPAEILSEEEKSQWTSYFDLKSKECVLHSPHFYYVESEMLLVAEKK